jgi:hypothetical protein
VLQNQEAVDFFDVLLKESGGKLQTAGAIGKGEKVWITIPSRNTGTGPPPP